MGHHETHNLVYSLDWIKQIKHFILIINKLQMAALGTELTPNSVVALLHFALSLNFYFWHKTEQKYVQWFKLADTK